MVVSNKVQYRVDLTTPLLTHSGSANIFAGIDRARRVRARETLAHGRVGRGALLGRREQKDEALHCTDCCASSDNR